MSKIIVDDILILKLGTGEMELYTEKDINRKPYRVIKDAMFNALFDRIVELEKACEEKDNKIFKLEGGTNGEF
jgi:hypothetical protein